MSFHMEKVLKFFVLQSREVPRPRMTTGEGRRISGGVSFTCEVTQQQNQNQVLNRWIKLNIFMATIRDHYYYKTKHSKYAFHRPLHLAKAFLCSSVTHSLDSIGILRWLLLDTHQSFPWPESDVNWHPHCNVNNFMIFILHSWSS